MNIEIANTDEVIKTCFPVMLELRPDLHSETFVTQIRNQQKDGYRLAFISHAGCPVVAAGFRISSNLAWGRFLYVDDLVTLVTHRSQGYGRAMLRWLIDYAKAEGCQQLHLDSGIQRLDAHRFYQREGMEISSYHFKIVWDCR